MIGKFFARIYHEFTEIHFAASSIAYQTLLSIVPFLIIVLAVFQSGVGLEKLYPKIEALLTTYMKEATGTVAVDYLRTALANVQPKALGGTGIILLMFTSIGLIRSIDTAFHRVWDIKTNRPALTRLTLYWMILLISPIALALIVGLRSVSYFNQLSVNIENQFSFSIWPAMILWIMYTFVPHIKVKFLAALPSAIVASLALHLVQEGFVWASITVFKKNKVYGSLASFPIFLLWLLVVWCVILFGVSMCSFIQQRILKRS